MCLCVVPQRTTPLLLRDWPAFQTAGHARDEHCTPDDFPQSAERWAPEENDRHRVFRIELNWKYFPRITRYWNIYACAKDRVIQTTDANVGKKGDS